MIKKTFYNLPEEKRQRIIDAIMGEFSSATTEKVSINRIIKEANISRGSFYQYFDDKVDLVEVLTRTFMELTVEGAYKAMDNSNRDIFSTYIKLYDIITEFQKDEKQKVILKNLFNNIRANDDLISEYLLNRFNGFGSLQEISKYYGTDNLKYKDEQDIIALSQILTQVLKNAIFDVFVMGDDCQKTRERYIRKIEIIKTGAVIS